MVTSSGKPTVTVTSVPDLEETVTISFAVPTILKSSVKRSTSLRQQLLIDPEHLL
jgi:hypothetical protein